MRPVTHGLEEVIDVPPTLDPLGGHVFLPLGNERRPGPVGYLAVEGRFSDNLVELQLQLFNLYFFHPQTVPARLKYVK